MRRRDPLPVIGDTHWVLRPGSVGYQQVGSTITDDAPSFRSSGALGSQVDSGEIK
jgi:hypothetical protein